MTATGRRSRAVLTLRGMAMGDAAGDEQRQASDEVQEQEDEKQELVGTHR